MSELEDAKKKAATTYNAASDFYDHPANTFWDDMAGTLSRDLDSFAENASGLTVGHSRYHLAVAGGYDVGVLDFAKGRCACTHLLPQGGTDCVQLRLLTFRQVTYIVFQPATFSCSSRIRDPAIPCPLPLAKAPESC